MAIPVELVITIEDGKGEKSSFGVFLPNGTTLAQVTTFWESFDVLVGALTDGGIVSASVSFPLAVDVLLQVAGVNSDVQEKAFAAFSSAEGFIKSLAIPAILETVFVTGSKLVDLTNTDVAAFVAAMVTGLTGINPCTSHGEDISVIDVFREAWGKYRS